MQTSSNFVHQVHRSVIVFFHHLSKYFSINISKVKGCSKTIHTHYQNLVVEIHVPEHFKNNREYKHNNCNFNKRKKEFQNWHFKWNQPVRCSSWQTNVKMTAKSGSDKQRSQFTSLVTMTEFFVSRFFHWTNPVDTGLYKV